MSSSSLEQEVFIFKDGNFLESIKFTGQFEIQTGDEEIVWTCRRHGAYVRSGSFRGAIAIWMIVMKPADAEQFGCYLVFVPSDWELVVNGHPYPSAACQDLKIDDKTIELKYKNYRFVFLPIQQSH